MKKKSAFMKNELVSKGFVLWSHIGKITATNLANITERGENDGMEAKQYDQKEH